MAVNHGYGGELGKVAGGIGAAHAAVPKLFGNIAGIKGAQHGLRAAIDRIVCPYNASARGGSVFQPVVGVVSVPRPLNLAEFHFLSFRICHCGAVTTPTTS